MTSRALCSHTLAGGALYRLCAQDCCPSWRNLDQKKWCATRESLTTGIALNTVSVKLETIMRVTTDRSCRSAETANHDACCFRNQTDRLRGEGSRRRTAATIGRVYKTSTLQKFVASTQMEPIAERRFSTSWTIFAFNNQNIFYFQRKLSSARSY